MTHITTRLRKTGLVATAALLSLSTLLVPLQSANATAPLSDWTRTTTETGGIEPIPSWGNYLSLSQAGIVSSGYYNFSSHDNGATWSTPPSLPADSLVRSSDDSTTLVAVIRSQMHYNGPILPGMFTQFSASLDGESWMTHTAPANTVFTRVSPMGQSGKVGVTTLNTTTNERTFLLSSDRGTNWTPLATVPDASVDWSFSLSNGGKTLIAYSSIGLFTSENSGATWQETSTYAGQTYRLSASIDGTTIVNLVGGPSLGQSEISRDNGLTWEKITLPGLGTYKYNASVSNDGTILTVAGLSSAFDAPTKLIYRSYDAGVTWTAINGPTDSLTQIGAAEISGDGSRMLALATYGKSDTEPYGKTGLFITVDGGDTWSLTSPPHTSKYWSSVVTSENGAVTIAAAEDGTYVRTNGVWKKTTTKIIGPPQINTNGTAIAALSLDEYHGITTSTDSGTTWETHRFDENYTPDKLLSVSDDTNAITILANNYDESSQTAAFFLSVSHDGGASWNHTPIQTPDNFMVQYVDEKSGMIIAIDAMTKKLSRSYIGSNDWTTLTLPPMDTQGPVFPQASVRHGVLIVQQLGFEQDPDEWSPRSIKQTVASFDSGATWNLVAKGESYVTVTRHQSIIAVDPGGALRYSQDKAGTWKTLTSTLPNLAGSIPLDVDSPTLNTGALSIAGDGSVAYIISGYGTYTSSAHHIYSTALTLEDDSTIPTTPPTLTFTPESNGASTTPTSSDKSSPQQITNNRPTFSGVATPGSTVTVTVRSDPVVCQATADETGRWSCTLPSTLPAGIHTITVEVTNPVTHATTVLGPYFVQLQSGSETITITPETPTGTTVTPGAPNTGVKQGPTFTLALALLGIVVVTAGSLYGVRRFVRK